MKFVLSVLCLMAASVVADVQFMVIPSAETNDAIANGTCSEYIDEEMESLTSLYALECTMDILPGEASHVENLGHVYQSEGSQDWHRSSRSRGGHRGLFIDCINDCWIFPKDAPLICCLLCSWCVGSSGGRRDLGLVSSTTKNIFKDDGPAGEVLIAKHLDEILTCMEGRFEKSCADESSNECHGCNADGEFTGSVSGFVTLKA
eukprot:Nitzschia sp. Nitz4//scaffold90_size81538//12171//12782//NITZ4_005313-RA/size81538-processed-gene-0.46-mRNA-1//-1//CDS//3329559993//5062//frame0